MTVSRWCRSCRCVFASGTLCSGCNREPLWGVAGVIEPRSDRWPFIIDAVWAAPTRHDDAEAVIAAAQIHDADLRAVVIAAFPPHEHVDGERLFDRNDEAAIASEAAFGAVVNAAADEQERRDRGQG